MEKTDRHDTSWPWPLPDELVLQKLLPACRQSWPALRQTSRKLCRAIDGSKKFLVIKEDLSLRTLPSIGRWLARLDGLETLDIEASTNASLAAMAAMALPLVPQLTSLALLEKQYEDETEEFESNIEEFDAVAGGAVFAVLLSRLQRLQVFHCDFRVVEWGPTAGPQVARALAQLPDLQELHIGLEMDGKMLREACDELGPNAWRSLEWLETIIWGPEMLEDLALAPMPCLTRLTLNEFCFTDVGRPLRSIAGACWGSQLCDLEMDIRTWGVLPDLPERLSNLRLPKLEVLALTVDHSHPIPDDAVPLFGWELPKLRRLALFVHPPAYTIVKSIVALDLPMLEELCIDLSRYSASAITAVLRGVHRMPHLHRLPHLQMLEIDAPNRDAGDEEWRALAAAPLMGLPKLSIGYCDSLDAASAAILASAQWLQGLEELELDCVPDAALPALRTGLQGFSMRKVLSQHYSTMGGCYRWSKQHEPGASKG